MIIDKTSPVPQYYQLETWLEEQIHQGVYEQNDKIPTEDEFANITGLARTTICHAIQNLVNKGYLIRKRRLGTFVNKRIFESQRQNIVAILVNIYKSGYAMEMVRGACDQTATNNYSIILCNTDDSCLNADAHADRLIEQNVSGVIFVPTAASDAKNITILEKLLSKGIKVVIADRKWPGLKVDNVVTDNFHGAYNITNYLIDKGHRKIAITMTNLLNPSRERLAGYKQALRDAAIPIDPSIIFANNERFSEKFYYEYARLVLHNRKKISAVFAGDDRMAYAIYAVAKNMNIDIPKDISLVGYDDIPGSDTQFFELTTVHQPIYEMGKKCMNLLMERIDGRTDNYQHIVLESYLSERRSVLPAGYYKKK